MHNLKGVISPSCPYCAATVQAGYLGLALEAELKAYCAF